MDRITVTDFGFPSALCGVHRRHILINLEVWLILWCFQSWDICGSVETNAKLIQWHLWRFFFSYNVKSECFVCLFLCLFSMLKVVCEYIMAPGLEIYEIPRYSNVLGSACWCFLCFPFGFFIILIFVIYKFQFFKSMLYYSLVACFFSNEKEEEYA